MVDFSASKDTLRNSEPRSQVGTAMYCAPEVLQNFNGAAYDAMASDVWSVGVVLFVMLFGRHPFSRAEDTQLPAQQQVLTMFKRLAAPTGSLDGDLYVPHMLPTSALPGAQPGAPLSLPCSDLLRGMLARDPRFRMTLNAVECHEWFQTSLPEGAALLNDVVEAEAAAAGEAAMMPASVAAQLEHMVIQAAKGPVGRPAALLKELSGSGGGSGAGGPGDGGGFGSVGGGDAGAYGCGGSGGGGGMRPVRYSSGSGASTYAPVTPQSASQGPQYQQQQQLQQIHQVQDPTAPTVIRTVTTGATSGVQQSVSIGSVVAGQQLLATSPQLHSGGDGAIAGGGPVGMAAVTSSTGTAPVAAAAAATAVAPEAHWPLLPRGGGGSHGGAAAGSDATVGNGDVHVPDLEALVMTIPDDDLIEAASLDLFNCPTPRLHSQLHLHHGSHLKDQYQSELLSDFSGKDPAEPHSNDTVAGCSSAPSPQQQTTPPHVPAATAAAGSQLRAFPGTVAPIGSGVKYFPDSASAKVSSHPLDAGPPTAPPALYGTAEAQRDARTSSSVTMVALMDTTQHHPAAAAAPLPPLRTHHPHEPPLFMSLHTAAAEAGDGSAGGSGGLLMRLRTESLPSPSTLAIVDAHPFLVHGNGSGSASGGGGGGSDGSRGLLGCLSGGGSYLRNLRDSSMATIPSTYSMDWCTLSARSEALLTPKAGATTVAATAGIDAGGSVGGAVGAPVAADSLAHTSLFHKFCQEARSTLVGVATEAKAAVTGLTRRS
ncbi:hypothetical protein Vafri_8076 [Volvox africanus]|nr:hypothetical protein Vafri_8076 [Volvox africanus]